MSRPDAANALASGQNASSSELSERDRDILEFERQWWKYAGAKEQAVRDKFDMSSTRYYQVLNALIDRPESLAFDPLLVRRLRRLRAARQRARQRAPARLRGLTCAVSSGGSAPSAASRCPRRSRCSRSGPWCSPAPRSSRPAATTRSRPGPRRPPRR